MVNTAVGPTLSLLEALASGLANASSKRKRVEKYIIPEIDIVPRHCNNIEIDKKKRRQC